MEFECNVIIFVKCVRETYRHINPDNISWILWLWINPALSGQLS